MEGEEAADGGGGGSGCSAQKIRNRQRVPVERCFIESVVSILKIFFSFSFQDTAGEERYSGLSSFYCRGASAAILAYDISQGKSLRALRERYLQLLDASEPNCLVVVVGTKKDIITSSSREIPSSAGETLALELNEKKGRPTGSFNEKPFFETSAKSGENVQKVFDFILNTCLPLDDEETAKRTLRQTTGIDLENKSQTQNESTKKCC